MKNKEEKEISYFIPPRPIDDLGKNKKDEK